MLPSQDSGAHGAADSDSIEQRLRRLETVTDVALSRLDVGELLPELLDRVRELLEADTAAVLLVDDSGQYLVAASARGLEEEVTQGSRIPVGQGFAGRIAAERRPVVLNEVSPATVVNPVLLFKGLRSMLGVPLLSDETVLGVLHVGTLRSRSFAADDVALLEQVADRAALAIQVARTRRETVAAEALQRSLTPQRLPSVPGLDLAARYVPGHRLGVGGDWYDVFDLPRGRVGFVMGDVMGRGLRAAVVMGRLRSALRAYALDEEDPARVLERLDRMVQHFEPGEMATVLYGVYDTGAGTLRFSSAGHPPPALTGPDGQTEYVDVPGDILLGAEPTARQSFDLALPRGSSLCMFTDGLVERRPGGLDAALGRLARVLSAGFASSDDACAEVMANLIGSSPSADDVALLVIRRDGT